MRKLCVLFFVAVLLQFSIARAQSVGINDDGSSPHTSAMLDVKSLSKGLLIPRVALSATNTAGPVTTPATSLLVYNTATAGSGGTAVSPGFYFWNSTSWEKITSSSTPLNAWSLTGNAGTIAGANFIGTTDAQPLSFKVNNSDAGFIHASNLNTAFGIGALHSALTGTGAANTAIGNSALFSITSGFANTATGVGALYYNTSGQGNTATGVNTLYSNTTGSNNTAYGSRALASSVTSSFNTAVGSEALYLNTVGVGNCAQGYRALYANTAGSYNTAVGSEALRDNTGNANSAFGNGSLSLNTSGGGNTAIGESALN